MAPTNPSSAFCHLRKYYYSLVVITIFSIHLVCFFYTAAADINNYNGGFSAHLIRRNSLNSLLYNHKRNKSFRRLMGPETPQSTLATDPDGSEHLMKLSIGTPPFDIYVIADTGSTLLWTQCQPCKSCFKTKHAIFDPKESSTYRNITCSQSECRLVDEFSPRNYCKRNPQAACMYDSTYADESYSKGTVAKEVITLKSTSGKVVILKDIVIGCGQNNSGIEASENEMGIIGLGRGPLSFASQISPYVGGKKFSYCFVPVSTDPKIESTINFGNGSEVSGEGVVSTPLIDVESDMDSYLVTMKGITIGNDFVPFNSTGTLLEKGNTLIDSGTALSYLPQDFYERVVNQLVHKLDPNLEVINYIDEDNSSSICFNTTTLPKAPNMAVHFDDGGKLQLTAEHIFRDEEKKLVCLGLMNSSKQGFSSDDIGVLGNNVQENFLIGFDLDKKWVSFKPTNCIKMAAASGANIATHLFSIFSTCLLYLFLIVKSS
ncbi:aspartic proteinase CDR1-like [Rosa rugosa]|uniref:aspartic proteinase CDR1-like n=1 Tax=Rosa rugosa TaxID=74645 RepID=UPI002B4039DB|nr:aspartic proteinase CDR1-like [Rosa rugosa]